MGVVIKFPSSAMVREPAVDKKRMAAILGVHPKFLERRHRAPDFPVYYDAAGRARYLPSEVKSWLAENEGGSNDAA